MNASAIKIEAIYHRFRISYYAGTYDQALLEQTQKEYSEALRECPLNHTKGDFDLFRVQKAKDFGIDGIKYFPHRAIIQTVYWLRAIGLYVAGMAIPPLIIAVIVFLGRQKFFVH